MCGTLQYQPLDAEVITVGRQQKEHIFIGWTNTTAIMPAWGAKNSKLGNNPLVVGIPYRNEAVVLDMSMSQFSYGAMELTELKMKNYPLLEATIKMGI